MILSNPHKRLIAAVDVILMTLLAGGSGLKLPMRSKVRFVENKLLSQYVERQLLEPIGSPSFIEDSERKETLAFDAFSPMCGKVNEEGASLARTFAANGFRCSKGKRMRQLLRNENTDHCDQEEQTSTGDRLSRGHRVPAGAAPSFVQVQYKFPNDKFSTCGGVLIHKDLVLTAAHCVFSYTRGVVIAGTVSRDNEDLKGEIVAIKKSCLPEDYRAEGAHYDFALLKLAKPLKYTEKIQPACLKLDEKPSSDSVCLASGLGLQDPTERAEYLRVLPMRQCLGVAEFVRGDVQCYTSDRELRGNTCKGDSGSPMYCYEMCPRGKVRAVAVGHLSLGPPDCGLSPQLSYYSDYRKVQDLIKQLLQECS